MSTGHKWRPLQLTSARSPKDVLIAAWMEEHKCDLHTALRLIKEDEARKELWANDLYQVEVRRYPEDDIVHLNIRRRDSTHVKSTQSMTAHGGRKMRAASSCAACVRSAKVKSSPGSARRC